MKALKKVVLPADPTIVVTDSGLGGISVLSDLERQIQEKNVFNSAELIFFNSHAAEGYGYNSMKAVQDKINVFDNALRSMIEKFSPDIILVACNTLSVITDQTPVYKETPVPILGIVEFGSDLIYENLSSDENSVVIIYGTPTTIDSDAYRKNLVNRGIDDQRIVNQPCYLLETEIQRDAAGTQTAKMIDDFTAEAFEKIALPGNNNAKCFGAFCCTHYGYSEEFFISSLNKRFRDSSTLNPNKLMSDFIISLGSESSKKTMVNVDVYSRVQIHAEEIDSIGNIIRAASPKTYRALSEYRFEPELFEFNIPLK